MENDIITGFKKIIKGVIRCDELLASHTSFKIGGPARIWVEPRDAQELKKILVFTKEHSIPVFVIGGGSNVLARDHGFNGVVVHLGAPFFKKIALRGHTVRVGAGFSVSRLVRFCCDKGLSGLESLIGIPGTVGGAVYMNAGGWTSPLYKNIGDFITSLKVMDYKGTVSILKSHQLEFGYRHSNLAPHIVLEANLLLGKDDNAVLKARCTQFLKMKREKQVLDIPSAGCVFKNPDNFQFTCGQMIDMLGLKGTRMGGAEISEKHANFIVNKKGARSQDVLKLIDFIQEKVKANYKIPLELEIKIL